MVVSWIVVVFVVVDVVSMAVKRERERSALSKKSSWLGF